MEAINSTSHITNSTQPNVSPNVCSLLGIFSWQQQYLTSKTFIVILVLASVELLICPFTILLNALVILAVSRKRYLRKKKPCILLACLAATDLLVGTVVLPFVITSHVLRILGVGPICLVDKIVHEMAFIPVGASFLHLVVISLERYISIKHALRYKSLVTTRRLTTAVVAAWAVSLMIGLVSLAFDLAGEIALKDLVMGILMVVVTLSGVLVVSFCQVAMLLESRRHRRHIKAHQISESSAKELLKNVKAARTTTIIIGVLCLCYFAPSIVFGVYLYVTENSPESLLFGFMYVDMFFYFNSLINPIIYCVRIQDFRRTFKEFLNLEASQTLTAEFEMNRAGRSREQRGKDNKARSDCAHKKIQLAWPLPTSPRVSRSRSLDLTKGLTHEQKKTRTKSV